MKIEKHKLFYIPLELYESHCRAEFWWGVLTGVAAALIGYGFFWLVDTFLQ
jgi:hypothetical protein